ncbi:tail fiber/spike domain-containing protein [Huaxiibacter chinensis]
MATQPTNLPVPSESPRDLKFNAGKIDEFVTSLVNTYVDRFGNEHYTIEGLRWLAQQAIAQYGWIPVGTFQAGATLTLPNQILKDTTDGEYYRWDGSLLPSGKDVPIGSTPGSTGGVGVGAWLSVGDSSLRTMLASSTGTGMIGSNHRNTLQDDLDAVDLRTSGQPLSQLLSEGKDIINDTGLQSFSVSSDDINISGSPGGSITGTKYGTALTLNGEDVTASGLVIVGPGDVLPTDTLATVLLRSMSSGHSIEDTHLSGASIGIYLHGDNATLKNNTTRSMTYHPSLVAGGYGILAEGVRNLLILGHSAFGDSVNDRHALYLSNNQAEGDLPNIDVRVIGFRANYEWANAGGVVGADGMPMINVRYVDSLIIDAAQLRQGGQGIHVLNDRKTPKNISITNSNVLGITKRRGGDVCSGIGIGGFGTVDKDPITNLIINGCNVQVLRATGVIDSGGRFPVAVALEYVRFGTVTGSVLSSPADSCDFLITNCQDLVIDGIQSNPSSASGTRAMVRFEGANNARIRFSNINKGSRPGVIENITIATDIMVDWQRVAEIFYNTGTGGINSDPDSLIKTSSISGSTVIIEFQQHVTTEAIKGLLLIPVLASNPISIVVAVSGKTITVQAYNNSGANISPSTGQVRFKVLLSK